MTVTVELKKHDNVGWAPEFKRSYALDEFEKSLAIDEINEAIEDFENKMNLNGLSLEDLEEYEKEDIENLKQLKADVYQLNCGDYTYWIIIQ